VQDVDGTRSAVGFAFEKGDAVHSIIVRMKTFRRDASMAPFQLPSARKFFLDEPKAV